MTQLLYPYMANFPYFEPKIHSGVPASIIQCVHRNVASGNNYAIVMCTILTNPGCSQTSAKWCCLGTTSPALMSADNYRIVKTVTESLIRRASIFKL